MARPIADRGPLDAGLLRVERLRAGFNLAGARDLALSLVAENPDSARALVAASRAESDAVVLLDGSDRKRDRNAAAWSAYDFARRSMEVAGSVRADGPEIPADQLAQYAYAMGAATHLRAMFARSGHARKTLRATRAALEVDPDNDVALATQATLELRLATLPWIARLFAWGAPGGSLDESVRLARRCVTLVDSIEYRLLLARALRARGDLTEAREVMEFAVASPPRQPRDPELKDSAEELLAELILATDG